MFLNRVLKVQVVVSPATRLLDRFPTVTKFTLRLPYSRINLSLRLLETQSNGNRRALHRLSLTVLPVMDKWRPATLTRWTTFPLPVLSVVLHRLELLLGPG